MRQPILAFCVAVLPAWCAGTGLYCVTTNGLPQDDCVAAKTYTSLPAALNGLTINQGATTFTATQTIRVYPGTYSFATYLGIGYITSSTFLTPTAADPLIIRSSSGVATPGGSNAVINCGSTATNAFYIYSSYTTIQGFEITNCRSAVAWGSVGPRNYITISQNYLHDLGGTAVLDNVGGGVGVGTLVDHNLIVNVPSALNWPSVPWTVQFNEIATATVASIIQSGGGSNIHDNITYNSTNGSGFQGGNGDTITGNVSYGNRYGIQSQIQTSGPGPTFTNNIVVGNMWTCHYEGGSNPVYGLMQHNLCNRSTGPMGAGNVQRIAGGPGSAAFEINNISWADVTVGGGVDKNLFASSLMAASRSDYNAWWTTGVASTVALIGNSAYATLTAFQRTGWDTHSFTANPRILGDPKLLATTSQVFPECPTIECRLAKIRRNYMPTNLALKGKGCTFNTSTFACTPDHTDIGPVPITVYNAPGITGGGVY